MRQIEVKNPKNKNESIPLRLLIIEKHEQLLKR